MLDKQNITLSHIQQVRLELYREFGEDAKEAFDFIMADAYKVNVTKNPLPENNATEEFIDGVYIIYNDGHFELFKGDNSKENVKYVGVICGGRRIAVALHDLGEDGKEYQFLKDGFEAPKHSVYYTGQQKISAFEDFNGKDNTHHIKNEYQSEIPFELLEDGEYIPSIGEFGILMMFASRYQRGA